MSVSISDAEDLVMGISSIKNGTRESTKHRVVVVDDHPIVRRGLVDLLDDQSDLEVCGEAAEVAEAMQVIEATRPDVIVVDLALKSGQGIELIELVKARYQGVKMLVSSVHDEMLFAERTLRAGALGYIAKEESTEHLVEAIHQVLRGEVYLSPRMSGRLLHHMIGGKPPQEDPIARLSHRELEAFEMIGQGLTIQQIAEKLQLSPKTIETHREKIKEKLDLKNSAELSRRAVQWVLEHKYTDGSPR
jgi:DNA-binding NarL/FixJ family response regulator